MDEANPDYAKIAAYIDRNPAAVLSTLREDGTPYGSVVYVVTASHHTVCLVTKTSTETYKNMAKRPQVSLTVFNERESSTLQAMGNAYITDDKQLIDYIFEKLAKVHVMQSDWVPPVTRIPTGEYVVIGIEITIARLAAYQGTGVNPASMFTQVVLK